MTVPSASDVAVGTSSCPLTRSGDRGAVWADALGRVVVYSSDDEFEIRAEPDRLPGLDFVHLDESNSAKSRLHLDFRPDDQEAEVARLVSHGGQRVDVGHRDQPWVVSADPEGTEFCILGQRLG